MSLEIMTSIIRKRQGFVLSENLDNSQYTGTTAKVVCLNMYTHIHPASVGWVSLYIRSRSFS